MTTLKIIEGQREEFFEEFDNLTRRHRHFENDEQGKLVPIFSDDPRSDIFNWHKQSIIQILESEIERKMGMKKEYTESFHVDEVEKNQAVKYKNHGEVGFNRCLKEDIAHLTVLLDSLK